MNKKNSNSIMNEQELRDELKKLKHGVLGVFPSDKIPKTVSKGHALIVNTAPKGTEGQHWLSLYRDPDDGILEIFDSFGLPLDAYPLVRKWIGNKEKYIRHNIGQLQSNNSDSCGVFCLLFLILRLKKKMTMNSFINIFDNDNLELNDCIALYWLVKYNETDLKNFENVKSINKCI